MHSHSCWITLTFATDPVTIAKRDLQIFFKRMRNAGYKFSYYACGEYGEKFGRPHYHICLFGHDFTLDGYPWRRTKAGHLLYRNEALEKLWKKGFVEVSQLTLENAGYTARYTLKKITGDMADEHYVREYKGLEVPITPEFQLSSRNPTIGKRWLEANWKECVATGSVVYKGKECPVPKYYSAWIAAQHPEEYKKLAAKQAAFAEKQKRETGVEMHNRAIARDHKTKRLTRDFENAN